VVCELFDHHQWARFSLKSMLEASVATEGERSRSRIVHASGSDSMFNF